jgi:hypothetical protein
MSQELPASLLYGFRYGFWRKVFGVKGKKVKFFLEQA